MSHLLATLADAAATTAATAKDNDPTSLDYLAAVIVLVSGIAAFLTLGGLEVLMSIGAIFPKRILTTSWSPEQEQSFVPYESANSGSHSRAWMISLVSGAIVFVFALGVYAGVEPEGPCKLPSGQAGKLDSNGKCSDPNQKQTSSAPASAPAKEAPKAPSDSGPKTEDKPADK